MNILGAGAVTALGRDFGEIAAGMAGAGSGRRGQREG